MRVNIPVFNIDWFSVLAALWVTALLSGVWVVVWELDQIRTDKEPQRVEVRHVFQQQQQHPPFERKTV